MTAPHCLRSVFARRHTARPSCHTDRAALPHITVRQGGLESSSWAPTERGRDLAGNLVAGGVRGGREGPGGVGGPGGGRARPRAGGAEVGVLREG